MINQLDKQYKVFDILKFPLITLVVLIHSIPVSGDYSTIIKDFDLYQFISLNISRNLGYIAVPTFFVISGCLFFSNVFTWSKEIYKQKISSRFKSLFIPYVFWNILFITVIVIKDLIFNSLGKESDFSYNLLTGSSIYEIFWKIPINYPLWYIRDLMVMCALSPLFYIFIKYLKHYSIIILSIIFFVLIDFEHSNKILFFALGGYFGIFKKDIVLELSKFKYYTISLSLIFAILSVVYFQSTYFIYVHRLYVLFSILAIFSVFGYLIDHYPALCSKLKSLSKYTFFIYCIHVIYVLDWIRGFLFKLPISNSEIGMIVSYFLLTILNILVCILIYRLLIVVLPKRLFFLIGR